MNRYQRTNILQSVTRALWGEVFRELRAVVCSLGNDRSFTILFYVDGQINPDDEDSVGRVVTEVIADFLSDFEISYVIRRLDSPANVPVENGFLIYLRKEPMNRKRKSDQKKIVMSSSVQ